MTFSARRSDRWRAIIPQHYHSSLLLPFSGFLSLRAALMLQSQQAAADFTDYPPLIEGADHLNQLLWFCVAE